MRRGGWKKPVVPKWARKVKAPANPVHLLNIPGIRRDGALIITLPIRLVSEANAHEHWRRRQQRAKSQRAIAEMLLVNAFGKAPAAPLVVKLTRIAPRALDSDNNVGSAKHVRDQVAAWIGVDDRSPLVTWEYGSEKGEPRTYGVRVEVRAG